MADFLSELVFLAQRFTWSLPCWILFLVSVIFYVILLVLKRHTSADAAARCHFCHVILISLLTTLVDLPAFSWLVSNTLPALLFAIPVIFMPELRRALERSGPCRNRHPVLRSSKTRIWKSYTKMIQSVVSASSRLSVFRQGALIVLQRQDDLREYEDTGVKDRRAGVSRTPTADLLSQHTPA